MSDDLGSFLNELRGLWETECTTLAKETLETLNKTRLDSADRLGAYFVDGPQDEDAPYGLGVAWVPEHEVLSPPPPVETIVERLEAIAQDFRKEIIQLEQGGVDETCPEATMSKCLTILTTAIRQVQNTDGTLNGAALRDASNGLGAIAAHEDRAYGVLDDQAYLLASQLLTQLRGYQLVYPDTVLS